MKNTKTKSTNKLVLTLAWSLCLLLGACAPSDKNQPQSSNADFLDLTKNTPFNIINGQDVDPSKDTFSYSIVALYNIENESLCTGSIIDNHYIITAAHCMPVEPRNILVLFGTSFKEAAKSKQFIRASDGIAHENYFKTMESIEKTKNISEHNWGDIALVEIDQDLPPGYKPIAISNLTNSEPLKDNNFAATSSQRETLLAGYGLFDGVKGTGSGLLRKTIVSIDNPSYSETEASLDQTNGTGACHGDSGGPAYVQVKNKYLLWGITSRGLKDLNNDCSKYSVYTKISAYKDWVIEARKLLSTRVLPPAVPAKQQKATAKTAQNQKIVVNTATN